LRQAQETAALPDQHIEHRLSPRSALPRLRIASTPRKTPAPSCVLLGCIGREFLAHGEEKTRDKRARMRHRSSQQFLPMRSNACAGGSDSISAPNATQRLAAALMLIRWSPSRSTVERFAHRRIVENRAVHGAYRRTMGSLLMLPPE